MSGKPAARQGDATQQGGAIVQGSASVLIGAPSGVACSVCPGGMAVGNPVNPLLGAKVLSGETDIALPGPLAFVLSRHYSSYQTDTPAPIGLFGPGWQTTAQVSLLVQDEQLILNDERGRSILFESLHPGEVSYSRTENLWLVRGGGDKLPAGHQLTALWQAIPDELRHNSHYYFATNSAVGQWWLLGYPQPYVPLETLVLPQPLPARRTLQGVIDRFGRTLQYQRDAHGEFAGEITQVTDGVGRRYQLVLTQLPLGRDKDDIRPLSPRAGWGSDNGIRLAAVYLKHDPLYTDELPLMPLVRYDYSAQGELVAVYSRASEPVRRFVYHDQLLGRLTGHAYIGRPMTEYEYDSQGRVISQHNPQGLDYQFEYHGDSTQVTDNLSRQTDYFFQGERGQKRLVGTRYPNGSENHYRYNAVGKLIASTDASGRVTEYEPDVANGHLLSVTTPDGQVTAYSYNRQGQQVATRQGDRRTTLQYDALGRLVRQTNALNQTTSYQYADAFTGLPCTFTDPQGGKKTLTWTDYGQLACYTDCSGKQIHYRYNLWGQLIQQEFEEGMKVQRHYDGQGRLAMTEDATGQQTQYHYNVAGDVVAMTAPDGSQITREYDVWGRLLQQQQADFTQQYDYDVAGRLLTLTNQNGAFTTFQYNEMDGLTQEIGFDGRTQRYEYNLAGELIRNEDVDLVTLWHYDDKGRLVRRQHVGNTEIAGNDEWWHYDKLGQLNEVSHHSEGYQVSVHYQRDRLGRVTQELQQVNDSDGELCWQHQVARDYDAQGNEAQLHYHELPAIAWQTYGSGHLLGLAFDGKGVIEFDRDNLHREQQRRFGQYSVTQVYSPAGQLAQQLAVGGSSGVLSQQYHYDTAGRLTDIAQLDNHIKHTYRYDPIGRLIAAQTDDARLMINYDAAGNGIPYTTYHDRHESLPLRVDSLLPTPPVCLNNRLHEEAFSQWQYNDYGSLTRKIFGQEERDYQDYRYDSQHRLVAYLTPDQHFRYLYDPFGRRVAKQALKVRYSRSSSSVDHDEWYGWDGDRLVMTQRQQQRIYTIYLPGSFVPLLRIETPLAEPIDSLATILQQSTGVDFPAVLCQQFDHIEQAVRQQNLTPMDIDWLTSINFTPERIAEILPAKPAPSMMLHVYHCDHLGTPLALVSSTGSIDWQITLDAIGQLHREYNPNGLYQPIRFQGQHYDAESGFHYNRYRYYSPSAGRYITQDPIGLRGGLNVYSYPLDPVQMVDPLGLNGMGGLDSYFNQPGYQEIASRMNLPMTPPVTTVKQCNDGVSLSGEGAVGGGGNGSIGLGLNRTKKIITDWLGNQTETSSVDDVCISVDICASAGASAGAGLNAGYSHSFNPFVNGVSAKSCMGAAAKVGVGVGGQVCIDSTTGEPISVDGSVGVGGGGGVNMSQCSTLTICAVESYRKIFQ